MDYLHWQLDALESIVSDEKKPDSLDLQVLRQITEDFSDYRRIGEGGCGEVYKGTLTNGVVIAVKKLKNSHTIDEKMFRHEVDSMTKVRHPNIVRFIGYCSETKEKALQMDGRTVMAEERQRLLCFEYMRKGSLDNYLTDELRGFEWHTRYQIIKGICCGLLYLHEEKHILHMDLKPANILLSDQMMPKITDFGLSRIEGISQTTSAQRLISPGYCAPEYIVNGKRSWKSDIYSLGVIMIELVTGSKQVPNTTKVLRRWRHRWSKSSKHVPLWYQQVKKCLELAVICNKRNPIKRPFIRDVVGELNKLDSWDGQIRESSLEKIISSPDDMLGIEPLELHFTVAHNKEQKSCSIELTNDTDYYMAFRIVTTSLLPFSIYPDKGIGIAAPQSKCTASITLSAEDTPQRNHCGEEFIVQSTRIDGSLTAVDITDDTFNDEGGNSQEKIGDRDKVVDEVSLTVLFDEMLHEEHQKDVANLSAEMGSLGTSSQGTEIKTQGHTRKMAMEKLRELLGALEGTEIKTQGNTRNMTREELTDELCRAFQEVQQFMGLSLHQDYKDPRCSEKPGSGAAAVESGGDVGGKLVHFDGPLAFTTDDLLCATAEIMGKSTCGSMYKATLEDGSIVAVKRFREKLTMGDKEFEANAAVLGRIRHPNLLALRAYYLGPKGEKLLVFDYMPNSSLHLFLHAGAPNMPVDWATRMTIAKGTARGLAYLHSDMSIVHGNLTASNVLLDEQHSPKISDFGLSRLMTTVANSSMLAAAGALGYRAPELPKLKKASTKTDVYNLGVIILELLTGKSPADSTNDMDLPQWVASIMDDKEEWTNEVFDLELMRDAGTAEDELMETLKLALHCVDPAPPARPEAREVLRQLEQIRPARPAPEDGTGASDEGGAAHVPAASAFASAGDDE